MASVTLIVAVVKMKRQSMRSLVAKNQKQTRIVMIMSRLVLASNVVHLH